MFQFDKGPPQKRMKAEVVRVLRPPFFAGDLVAAVEEGFTTLLGLEVVDVEGFCLRGGMTVFLISAL
jgi:hypothetical protein